MKIKIAICDDEQEICNDIYSKLSKIAEEKALHFEMDCFLSGEELCNEMKDTKYDLIFLDIELPKMNGVEVGTYIRNTLNDEVLQIAYISSKKEYAMELFESRPINFLVKPIEYQKVKKLIDKFLLISQIDTRIFTFKQKYDYVQLLFSDIIYFTSSGRKVIVVTQSKSYEFYGSLEKIYNEFKQNNFLYVHKSFIVNYRFIKIYEYEQITMTNDKIIPISQTRRKAIRSMFMKIKEGEI